MDLDLAAVGGSEFPRLAPGEHAAPGRDDNPGNPICVEAAVTLAKKDRRIFNRAGGFRGR